MIRVRNALERDAFGMAALQVETFRKAYRGMIPDDWLDAMSIEDQMRQKQASIAARDPRIAWYVAETAAGNLCGYGRAGPNAKDCGSGEGEFQTLYVRPGLQGRGIGRRLLGAMGGFLDARGFRSALVWVMTVNHPARAFYARCGGTLVDGFDHTEVLEPSIRLPHIAYRWSDLPGLAAAGAAA